MTAKDLMRALSGGKGVSGYESDLVPLLTQGFAPWSTRSKKIS